MEIIKKWEMKKCIYNKTAICLIVILFVGKIVSSIMYNAKIPDSVNIEIYKKYIEKIEGPYSKEKVEYIESEIERISDISGNEYIYAQMYNENKMTRQEFEEAMAEARMATTILSTLGYIYNKCVYFEMNDRNGEFYYDLDAQRYVTVIGIDFIGLIYVIYVCISLFFADGSMGTSVLVKTSFYGTNYIQRLRYIYAMMIGIACTVISIITEFLIKYTMFDINCFDKPVKSMYDMRMFKWDISVGKYIMMNYIIRIVIVALIVTLFSVIIRKKERNR